MIYFIYQRSATHGDLVKIGTTKSPETLQRRLKTFACGNPDPLIVLHTQPGNHFEESRIHRNYAALRLGSTEWFRLEGNLRRYLDRVCDDDLSA